MSSRKEPVPILRDYLYLDVDKVKSIAGQLEWGVPEDTSLSEKTGGKRNLGWDKAIGLGAENSREVITQRSVLDSLFPDLEAVLEGAWLQDVSESFRADNPGLHDELKKKHPEGSLVRLTADCYLLDSQYLTESFLNLSLTINGVQWFGSEVLAAAMRALPDTSEQAIEEAILQIRGPKGAEIPDLGAADVESRMYDFGSDIGISTDYVRALMRTIRGIVPPGLNMYAFSSGGDGSVSMAARLQRERRYLDADPDVVAANFGLDSQPWTIVGTIGHYSSGGSVQTAEETPEQQFENFMQGTAEKFNRGNFIRQMSTTLSQFGRLGFLNIPQHPGFTIVPIAVYRAVAPVDTESL
ncbi:MULTISPECIES: DUF6414 family protein [Amycolatopsis]|uniref:DUF6414 family protein n=1 Tax=Amycolatopsis TaxID=1813 RepID=UPI0033AC0716